MVQSTVFSFDLFPPFHCRVFSSSQPKPLWSFGPFLDLFFPSFLSSIVNPFRIYNISANERHTKRSLSSILTYELMVIYLGVYVSLMMGLVCERRWREAQTSERTMLVLLHHRRRPTAKTCRPQKHVPKDPNLFLLLKIRTFYAFTNNCDPFGSF